MENLESRSLSYTIVQEFLSDLKKEFGKGNNEIMKVAELKKVEQESKTIKEFIQEFRKVVRKSIYEKRLLIEKFKEVINKMIKRKLIEAKRPLILQTQDLSID